MLKWPFYSLPSYGLLWKKKGFFFMTMTLNQLQLSNKADVGLQKWRKVHWINSKRNNCKTICYSGIWSQCSNASSFNVDSPLPSQLQDLLTNVSTVELRLLAPGMHQPRAHCRGAQNFNATLSQEETNTVILIMMMSCLSPPIIFLTFFISCSQTEYLQTEKTSLPFLFFHYLVGYIPYII